jgi:spermidine synthase
MAALSGFIVLGLEILALHLFSQVLHNSSYTFASVLVVVIAALTVGALVTQAWELDARTAWNRLGVVLLLTACAAAFLPRLFFLLTGGMTPFGSGQGGFTFYILRILGSAALVLGPPFILAGWMFPLVLAGAGGSGKGGTGAVWGRLLGVNAAGALLGLLTANHVAMPLLGLWKSLLVWCLIILMAAFWVMRLRSTSRRLSFSLVAAALLILLVTRPWSLPVTHLDAGERVVAWQAGPDGVAAVIDQGANRRIKWNNTYSLGGSANAAQQARMGYLPLLLHPQPRRVAFVGSATGITSSSALRDPAVESLTAVELSALTMQLACDYFGNWNENLCANGRTRTVVEDGRLFLRATRDSFDVIVGDLFVPWRSGVANLYTQEHFETVRSRLQPGGIFAQWLPLFQLDAEGFWGIAATFVSVFPNAWLAIADFQPLNPGVALIGWRDESASRGTSGPDARILAQRCAELGSLPALREPMLRHPAGVAMFLVGPVAPVIPSQAQRMTVDRPWLADHAPRVQRAMPPRFFVGGDLVVALQRIARHAPEDPLRPSINLGQQLYAFSLIMESEGPQRAATWYQQNVRTPLPSQVFVVPQALRMSWPFTEQTGVFLLRRAQAEARAGSP